jgi:ribosomal protein S1
MIERRRSAMKTNIFKTFGVFCLAACVLTGCAYFQNGDSSRPAAEVTDEEAVATMEEIAGIMMSGPVEVQTLVAHEPGAAFAVVTSATAEVVIKSINARTRVITIETKDGQTKKYTAGPAVKNFDKLKAGDTVTATFTEIMAVYLGQEEAASAEAASGLARRRDGMPGAALFGDAQVTARVLELDKATRRIKLEFPENEVREAKVRDGIDLSQVKVGDSVTVSITSALVIEVAQ